MKILINEGGEKGRKIKVSLLTSLVLNRFTAGIVAKETKNHGKNISKEQIAKLMKAASEYKKKNKDWVLVDVESADGDKVKIML